jgi:hypothetical protein
MVDSLTPTSLRPVHHAVQGFVSPNDDSIKPSTKMEKVIRLSRAGLPTFKDGLYYTMRLSLLEVKKKSPPSRSNREE